MLKISSILKFIQQCVESKDPRVVLIDDEHLIVTTTGVKLHLYDEWFKFTHEDEVIATMKDFNKEDQEIVQYIKELITDPEKVKYNKENYVQLIQERRKKLSDLFETPTPIIFGEPIEVPGAVDYIG